MPNHRFRLARPVAAAGLVALALSIGLAPVALAAARASTVVLETPSQQYVIEVYSDLFGRAPDPGGLQTWTAALLSGTPRVAIANAITGSQEYRGSLITASYLQYLKRAPDGPGLASWLGAMSSGMTIQQMESGFILSPEYYARAGSTDRGWAAQMYSDVLGRVASTGEIDYWASRLSGGVPRVGVAFGFLLSAEHLGTVIDGYYQHLLGRALDSTGRAGWVGAIQGGVRMEVVIGGIIASPEYYSRFIPASANGSAIIEIASRYVGVPYLWGGSTPAAFDCSGLTSYVYAQVGIILPRTSTEQHDAGGVISRDEAKPGDLIWAPGHIAIYAGGNLQIDAQPATGVQFRPIYQTNPVFLRFG